MKKIGYLIFIFQFLFILTNAQITDSVTIGTQVWTTKNLNVTTFRTGDPIPEAESAKDWKKAVDEGKPAWCHVNGDASNDSKYGKLYNWYAVNDKRGLAPKGWHIPSNAEWETIVNYLGGNTIADNKMKGTSEWEKNGNGDNNSGFSAFPAGFRYWSDAAFGGFGYNVEFWTSSESGNHKALAHCLNYIYSHVGRNDTSKKGSGFSVRCIKEQTPCTDLIVPSEFTINGNGLNNKFVVTTGNPEKYLINIYDRWGHEIYKSTDPNQYWDGNTEGGSLVLEGTYYYTIQITCQGNVTKKSGFLQVTIKNSSDNSNLNKNNPQTLNNSYQNGFTNKNEAKNFTDSKGLKQGKWVEYLDSNCGFTTQEKAKYFGLTIYKDSKPQEIIRVYYYSSGNLYEEIPYGYLTRGVGDVPQINGVRKWYYENGRLMEEDPVSNGELNGTLKKYYRNGDLNMETPYANGKKNGKEKWFYGNGVLGAEAPFTDNKLNGIVIGYYISSGKDSSEDSYSDDRLNGSKKLYYENGKLKSEISYKDGKRNGVSKDYYESGNVKREVNFEDGKIIGEEKNYEDNSGNSNTTVSTKKSESENKSDASRGSSLLANQKDDLLKKIHHKYALLIGTNHYSDKEYCTLNNPEFDAGAIADKLKNEYGFDVKVLDDPPRDTVVAALMNYSETLDSLDQFYFFVAGHGGFDSKFLNDGFIVLTDSKSDKKDPTKSSYLTYSFLTKVINNYKSKQIMVMLDVCFGGTFDPKFDRFRSKKSDESYFNINIEKYLSNKLQYRTRILISSGGKSEVPEGNKGEHSPFAYKFLEALEDGLRNGFLTANDIYSYVEKLPSFPISGSFAYSDPGADFVFIANP